MEQSEIVVYSVVGLMLIYGLYIIIKAKMPKGVNKRAMRYYLSIYDKLYRFPLTTTEVKKIRARIQKMALFSMNEIKVRTVQYYVVSTASGILIAIIGIILYRDIIVILLLLGLSVIVSIYVVDKAIVSMNRKIWKQLRQAVSSIRKEYNDSVVEALKKAQYGNLVRRSFDGIIDVLESSDGEQKLREYIERTPYRVMQTIAYICYEVNNQGDERNETNGSNFIAVMTMISKDINEELSRELYKRKMYGNIEYLPFIPIPFIAIIEKYFKSIIPGTVLIYNGMGGYIFHIAIILAAITGFATINKVINGANVVEDDRSRNITEAMDKWVVKRFAVNISPKGKARERVKAKLRESLSKKKVEDFYIEKFIYGFAVGVLSLLTVVCATSLTKSYMLGTTEELGLIASTDKSEYEEEDILRMDNEYMRNRDAGVKYDNESIQPFVLGYMPNLSELSVLDQWERIESKYTTIKNAYFKWWYMFIVLGCFVGGWFIPNVKLKMRSYLILTEAEEDFLQLQTLISIMMYTNCDTLDLLGKMTQISKVHKDMLLYCYHSYTSNPELELTRLRSKTPLIEFKMLVDSLKKTVSDKDLKEAFSDLIWEREYITKTRDEVLRASIRGKRGLCGKMALLSLVIFVLGELLYPLGYLGLSTFMDAMTSLRS